MHMHQMQIAVMTLKEFMAREGISIAEAAERLKRDQTLIGRYRARSVTPSPEVIAEIVEWSKGDVTIRELLADPVEVRA